MAPFMIFFFSLLFRFCISTNTLNPNQTIEDGQTLVSSAEIFALGFFSPGNSKNRYLGIWYNKTPDKTVVWVANRENPVSNSSGILSITDGNLKLIHGRDHVLLWSTNVSTVASYISATLMDSGNLVLKDDRENIMWESFNHPTHSFLPGMKLGLDRRAGLNRALTSWKSAEDPARGEFWFGLGVGGMGQYFLMRGSDRMFRSGPWYGERLSGAVNVSSLWSVLFVDNDDETYLTYTPYDSTLLTRMVLNESGVLQRLTWSNKSRQWNLAYTGPRDRCDKYARCGPYGSCDPSQLSEFECKCLQGFKPRSARDWQRGDWTDGCMRREPLDCGKGDGFLSLARVKLPDTSRSIVKPRLSLQECKDFCLKNCSCIAYTNANISGEGSSCVMWGGDLIDLKVYFVVGQEIYTRVAASELDERPYKHSRDFTGMKKLVVTISTVASVVVLAFIACGYYWWKKAKGRKVNKRCDIGFSQDDFEDIGKSSKLSMFHLNIIVASTNNFSEANMLGRGGFGAVYKGKLLNGLEIAVKRLSMNSGQGIEEFKNEVLLIAKLQHKNLVRLLGCCIEEEEKMLVYEYMQNKSLDSFIFDETRRVMLDWRKRFSIIMGIARGVLYLHEDSRLRIIHRDLKVSNVLLDEEMNPKISDFGLARIFGGNETQAKTHRVVGTYGYMSPEYALNGLFSIKSDVFSFGIILLEIISGKRNNCCDDCYSYTLIGYAWELWKEGKTLELVDSLISESCCQIEVSRCIEVGLLCVQESAKERPDMSSVVFMLGNEVKVPSPKKPAFFLQKEESYSHTCCSNNDVTITDIEAR